MKKLVVGRTYQEAADELKQADPSGVGFHWQTIRLAVDKKRVSRRMKALLRIWDEKSSG